MPDYLGSKGKLLPFIFQKIEADFPNGVNGKRFADVCSGTGAVSRGAAVRGFKVDAVDLMVSSGCSVMGSIGIPKYVLKTADKCLEEMNQLPGVEGVFFHHYSESAGKEFPGRRFFTDENAKKIDAARQYVDTKTGKLRDYLMYCLLEAFSSVQNASGVHTKCLPEIKRSARSLIVFKHKKTWDGKVKFWNEDIFKVVDDLGKVDVAYIDPPYCTRQYGYYFHLYETLVRGDNPDIAGASGYRRDKKNSVFCVTDCLGFLVDVVAKLQTQLVYVSYSSEGIISKRNLDMSRAFLKAPGVVSVKCFKKRHKSFKNSQKIPGKKQLYEYLFRIQKTGV